jgi:hypothetical protein
MFCNIGARLICSVILEAFVQFFLVVFLFYLSLEVFSNMLLSLRESRCLRVHKNVPRQLCLSFSNKVFI